MHAIRIVSIGFTFCSAVSLMTSYYMLIDRIRMATCFACLQNGLLYILLPILGSTLFGTNGMWAGFVIAPVLTLIISLGFVYLRFGKDNFPFILQSMDSEIDVIDDTLTTENVVAISKKVGNSLEAHQYSPADIARVRLLVEEIGIAITNKNSQKKKDPLIEYSLFYEEDSVLIIERDSGVLFDLTDPDNPIEELNDYVLNALMESQKEKAYLVTTGYNRNIIRFQKGIA